MLARPVLRPAAAVRAPGQARARGASRRAVCPRARPARSLHEPVLMRDPRHLGALPRLGGGAASIDGVPVCAVQEERLSRRKNDAAFPAGRHRVVPGARGRRARAARRGGLLREADAQVRAHPDHGAARASRARGAASRSAMKNALGEKLWVKGIIASELGVPRRPHPLHRAPPGARRGGLPRPRRPRARRHPHRRRRRRVGDALGRTRLRSPTTAARRSSSLRELRFPHSLGMLYSTFTAYLGFPVNEGEYKVMGLASYGKPRVRGRRCARHAAAHAGRRLRAGPRRTSNFTPRRAALVLRSRSSTSSGRRAIPASPSISGRRRARATPTSRPACSACWRTCSSTWRDRSSARPGSTTSASAAAWR